MAIYLIYGVGMIMEGTNMRNETTAYYKREVSLMDKRIFPRNSLDKAPENPDIPNSIFMELENKTDQEIISNTIEALKKTGTK